MHRKTFAATALFAGLFFGACTAHAVVGNIETVAGGGSGGPGGPATSAALKNPAHLAVAADGSFFFIDLNGLYKVDSATGQLTLLQTTPAPNPTAGFTALALSPLGEVYFGNQGGRQIFKIDAGGATTLVAGLGPCFGNCPVGDGGAATSANLSSVAMITFDAAGNLFVADESDGRVRMIDGSGTIRTVAGVGPANTIFTGDDTLAVHSGLWPSSMALGPAGQLFVVNAANIQNGAAPALLKIDSAGRVGSVGTGGMFPGGLVFDPSGNLYFSAHGMLIFALRPDGTIVPIAGRYLPFPNFFGDGGPASNALFYAARPGAWDPTGGLLVLDSGNNRIRRISITDSTPDPFAVPNIVGAPQSVPVQSATVTPTGFADVADVVVAGGEYSIGCAAPFTSAVGNINPGQSICFRHTTAAAANADSVTQISIGGMPATFRSTTATDGGSFTLDQATIAFAGTSMYTRSAPVMLKVTNTGPGSLQVNAVTASSGFSGETVCSVLPPAGSCGVKVYFTPIAEGAATGTLTIRTSSGDQVVQLSGTGERSLITHYYQAILGRDPEPTGKAFWEAEAARVVADGGEVNEVWFAMAQQFFASAEYTSQPRDDAAFVTDLYRTFFDRDPDSSGLSFWTGLIQQGMPREVVLTSFLTSPEYASFTQRTFGFTTPNRRIRLIMDMYRGILNRLPDDSGLCFWITQFNSAQTPTAAATLAEQMALLFLQSPEYAARHRSPPQLVGDLYNAMLRRGGDLAGVQFWIDQVTAGTPLAQIVHNFAFAREFADRSYLEPGQLSCH